MFMHAFKEKDTKGVRYHHTYPVALNQPEVANLKFLKTRKYKMMVCTISGHNL